MPPAHLRLAVFLLSICSIASAQSWRPLTVPDVWKRPPGGVVYHQNGYCWFVCWANIPTEWKGQKLELYAEAVDDAREFYFNGQRIGRFGSFPPKFRSGLGAESRFSIPADAVRWGEKNLIAIRVHQDAPRTNFNVAAPAVFAPQEAIHLRGSWMHRGGDNKQWSQADFAEHAQISEKAIYQKTTDAKQLAQQLKRLVNDAGPQSLEKSTRAFKTPDDLKVELAIGEPHVRQPLSIKFDARGRMWVVQYLQYPNPAGLKMISRDKYLRSVYDKVPPAPPNHFPGADKITIHEDRDNDGQFDTHKTFVDGLSLVSSFAIGRGGVWVLNPPYLLFYPDRDQDDSYDGPPEVHLQGFGIEDSHSISNSLRWGPDGWLYATQGSTVTGNIKRPGSKQKPIHSMGQLVWRYHPKTRRYEIFAEGGGNAFGLELDEHGRAYSGHNGGNTRGFHYVQGGYYRKGFGKHGELSNPYAFGYFPSIEHHSVPRFTHDFVIYQSGALPKAYDNKIFAVAPLQGHLLFSDVQGKGSTFRTKDLGYAMQTSDSWHRPVDVQTGPDGAVYVADFYEQKIDHSSHYQGRVHRESGRIYRLSGKDAAPFSAVDLTKKTSAELVETLRSPIRWKRQTALRLLADRADKTVIPSLKKTLARQTTDQHALECLWALNLCGGLQEAAMETLRHPHPQVRLWTVRLLADERRLPEDFAAAAAKLAETEPSVQVRSQLACSARRLPAAQGLPIIDSLLRRSEDADDPHLPLLLWWGVEHFAESDREAALRLLEDRELWRQRLVQEHLLSRWMRRYAQAGGLQNLQSCARLLELAPDQASAKKLLAGLEEAQKGQTLLAPPEALLKQLARWGGGSLALRLRQGQKPAVEEALKMLVNDKANAEQRILLANILSEVQPTGAAESLLQVAEKTANQDVAAAVLAALQAFDREDIGRRVVQRYAKWSKQPREAARTLLASRPGWSLQALQAVDAGELAAETLPLDLLLQMQLHENPQINALLKKHWGRLQGAALETLRAEIRRLEGVLKTATGNPYKGKVLFAANCGKCHRLFDQGGRIGPDLTSYQRSDSRRMLLHVVHPSAEIREGFENYNVIVDDGRILQGFIADQTPQTIVLRGADGQSRTIAREKIDEMAASKRSLMPEGLLKTYDAQQVRDLFAYLRATQPLP